MVFRIMMKASWKLSKLIGVTSALPNYYFSMGSVLEGETGGCEIVKEGKEPTKSAVFFRAGGL